jgi:hypothetical protein
MSKFITTFFLILISICFVQCQYNNYYHRNFTQSKFHPKIQHPVYNHPIQENWRYATRTPPVQRPNYAWKSNQHSINNSPHSYHSYHQQNYYPNPNHHLVQALNKIPASWLYGNTRQTTYKQSYVYYRPSTTRRYYGKYITRKPAVVYWDKNPPKGRQVFLPIRKTTTTERYPKRIYYQQQKNNHKIFVQPKHQYHHIQTTTKRTNYIDTAEQDLAFATRKPKINSNSTTTRKWRSIRKNFGVTKNYHYNFKTSKPRYVYPVYPSNQNYKYVPPKNKGNVLYFDRKTGIAMKNPPNLQTRKVFYHQNSHQNWKIQTRTPRIQKQWISNQNYQSEKTPLCHGCNHPQQQSQQHQKVYFA